MMVSADGYYEGPHHDLSWHNVDEEFEEFSASQLDDSGVLVFGRRTYELMATFWPSEYAREADPQTYERMNNLPKVVFSNTLDSVSWQSTTVSNNIVATLHELQHKYDKDIAVLGSSDLAVSLLREKLLDEVRLMINPVVLGAGKSLFKGLDQKFELLLRSNRHFSSGNVLLTYKVNYP
jgi:dihydrofolate reductase